MVAKKSQPQNHKLLQQKWFRWNKSHRALQQKQLNTIFMRGQTTKTFERDCKKWGNVCNSQSKMKEVVAPCEQTNWGRSGWHWVCGPQRRWHGVDLAETSRKQEWLLLVMFIDKKKQPDWKKENRKGRRLPSCSIGMALIVGSMVATQLELIREKEGRHIVVGSSCCQGR